MDRVILNHTVIDKRQTKTIHVAETSSARSNFFFLNHLCYFFFATYLRSYKKSKNTNNYVAWGAVAGGSRRAQWIAEGSSGGATGRELHPGIVAARAMSLPPTRSRRLERPSSVRGRWGSLSLSRRCVGALINPGSAEILRRRFNVVVI